MPTRKRVLFACTEVHAHGGIQRFNRTLLAAIEELGVDCDVYALNDEPRQPSATATLRAELSLHNTAVPQVASPANQRLAFANVRAFARDKPRFAAALLRALILGQYDFVIIGHVHFATFMMAVTRLRLFGRPRILLVAHGTDVWTGIKGARRWAAGAVDQILCVSQYTKRMIQEQAPELHDSRFALFPNALGRSWVQQQEALLAAESSGELPGRFILSVARLSRHDRTKGVLTVIEALAQLDPSLHYVIAGHGDDMDFLKQTAQRVGVAERVHFLGAVADEVLVNLYRKCAAFVLPSSQEGFGIVFLEAMFFGAPVIAAREKGAVDVVRDSETGLLVTYGDVTSLAQTIERLLTHSVLRDQLRGRALATVTGDGVFTFRAFTKRCAAALDVPYECHQSVARYC